MWLYGFEKLARMSSWNDQEAIDFAEQAMRLKARAHFKKLNDRGIANFNSLKASLLSRFGESCTALMTQLEHRKHQEGESVRDYIDDMTLLFEKSDNPADGQAFKFVNNLNSAFKERVINRGPVNMGQAEEYALYFQDIDISLTPVGAMALANKRTDKDEDHMVVFGKECPKAWQTLQVASQKA